MRYYETLMKLCLFFSMSWVHTRSTNYQNCSDWVFSFLFFVCVLLLYVLFVCSVLKRIVFLLLLLFILYLFSFATQHTYNNFLFFFVAIVFGCCCWWHFVYCLVLVHKGKCAIKNRNTYGASAYT